MTEPRELLGSADRFQQRLSSFALRHGGRLNLNFEHKPLGVHQQMPFASLHLFASVIASYARFSVVFTLWLSMMAALGSASRPNFTRISSRNTRLICSQRLSRRQRRK